jgi:ABC-type dipeptide/oligopeptide/nickel transport system permease subunit
MVAEAKDQRLFRPWLITGPGTALILLIFAANLVDDAVGTSPRRSMQSSSAAGPGAVELRPEEQG